MIAPELLNLLCCPVSRQPLREATAEELAVVNGPGVMSISGSALRQPVHGGLVREDGTILYPIWDDIPCLIASEGIALPAGKE